MIKSSLLTLLILSAALQAAPAPAPPAKRTANEVLLVYTAASPISKSVADDYADKRAVKNIVAIHCVDAALNSDNETIPLATYSANVETPIRDYLSSHHQIQFIVLTKGVPIRISGSPTGVRPDHSPPTTPLRMCLDSALAAMDYDHLAGARKLRITGSGRHRLRLCQPLLERQRTLLPRKVRRLSRHPPRRLHRSRRQGARRPRPCRRAAPPRRQDPLRRPADFWFGQSQGSAARDPWIGDRIRIAL